MNKNMTSFWKFIQEHSIEIPVVQRDYAQGRIGKEYLRKNFLSKIQETLDSSDSEKKLVLDFVYGPVEGEKSQPLDGQQRLTTLWLLHWYIALRTGELKNVCEILKKFTYETRISSREFCQSLCKAENFENFNFKDEKIVVFIKSRTWFYSSWEQDPTIQSMLNMLGGTSLADKQGENIMDGIEELLKDKEDKMKEYWNKLVNKDAIVFRYLSFQNLDLSDDLYIKMNARGKQLTAFENFKADLIGYIQRKAEESGEKWKEVLNGENGLPHLLDVEWTNIFWEYRSNKNNPGKETKIDEIYFAFLNRYFFNRAIVDKILEGKKETKQWKLYGKESDDSALSYDNFDVYSKILTRPGIFKDLKEMFENLPENFNETIKDCLPKWFNKNKFNFIPVYEEADRISTLTQAQRIVFFGVCRYLEQSKFNEDRFRKWMRVVCNLVGNTKIDMAAHMKLIDELSEHIENIYEFLASNPELKSKASPGQLKEEIAKAKQMLSPATTSMLPEKPENWDDKHQWNWETAIVEAENHAFFHGAIRFLFQNNESEIDWADFCLKWENVQKFFKKDHSPQESAMNHGFNNAILLKSLISNFSEKDFETILWWNHRTFNNKPESWMYYLLNTNICSPVHQLLINGGKINCRTQTEECVSNYLYLLSNTGLLDFVIEEIPNSWIRRYHGHDAIYPSATGVFLNAKKRNKFLLETAGVLIDDRCKIENTELLYGTHINFKYKGKDFQWYADNDFVYLMEDGWAKLKDGKKTEETEKYYCFDTEDLSNDKIRDGLESLIKKVSRYCQKYRTP